MKELQSHVTDPQRLQALRSVALLDTPAEEAFDRLARLAARLLDAPVALVSLVDADRQFFKSCVGLETEPWKTERETPLSHSFCQHNRVAGQALVIEDARDHPLVADNKAIGDLGVIAYLGFPLATPDGYILGSFCVIDSKPRKWANEDVEILRDLAAAVMVEIQLRSEVATRHRVEGERDTLTDLNQQLRDEMAARKLAEEQSRYLEAQLDQARQLEVIAQLAGGVAHDLNNLLAPVLIYTSVLLEDPTLDRTHGDIVEKIQDAGLKSRNVIRQLLAFSRMQPDELAILDVNSVIRDLHALVERMIPEDLRVSVVLNGDVGEIRASKTQIERVISNLVVNAVDAMPNGGALAVETTSVVLTEAELVSNPDAKPGRFVQIEVRDNGKGIDPETQSRLFEPFYSTKGTAGTGLGLTTVLGIVLAHGGVVKVDSVLGEGTAVRVLLPLTEERADGQAVEDLGPRHVHGTETILVAEDDPLVRQSTVQALTSEGFSVLSAVDGADALVKLRDFDDVIDLLLTDVVMPEMNGRSLYDEAVKLQPNLRVLYMSGYNDDIVSHRGGLADGAHFIAKPFLRKELLEQVCKALDGEVPTAAPELP